MLTRLTILALVGVAPLDSASARGGVGGGGAPPAPPALLNALPPAGPALPAPTLPVLANGFSIVGFVQNVSVTGGCGAASAGAGGTVTINGVVITVPTNTIVQFPASTRSWLRTVCPLASEATSPIALDGTGAPVGSPALLPSIEMRVEGNIVPTATGAAHTAGLIFVSQQSLNSGSGYISFIDYTDGSIYVTTAPGAGSPAKELRLLIADVDGVYGLNQKAFDARFSVDSKNPTIRAEGTGYPLCVPRVTPPTDDPRCPQKNRPKLSAGCRNFAAAGWTLPKAGDLPLPVTTPPSPAQADPYCVGFVMKAVPGMPGAASVRVEDLRVDADPDPREQAPFEIGDFITWQGTLVRGGNTLAPIAKRPTSTPDLIWAHTINANVGIFTQPKTLPAYLAVGEFRIGVDPQPTGAIPAAAGVETTDRLVLEAVTTDIASLVDVYYDDLDPVTKKESFRWLTIDSVTNTLADQFGNPFAMSAQPFGGGIQTQFTEAAAGRARVRQNKVLAIRPELGACPTTAGSQACAVTQSPTRYIRAVLRSLCAPKSAPAAGVPIVDPPGTPPKPGNPGNIDGGVFYGINGTRPALHSAATLACLESAKFANGLNTGQYQAPTTDFVFAEIVMPGMPIVAHNFWQMDFLVRGEGGVDGNSAGPQSPRPW